MLAVVSGLFTRMLTNVVPHLSAHDTAKRSRDGDEDDKDVDVLVVGAIVVSSFERRKVLARDRAERDLTRFTIMRLCNGAFVRSILLSKRDKGIMVLSIIIEVVVRDLLV